ncbi:IclR family transcriptional regulator [soil metagenome]
MAKANKADAEVDAPSKKSDDVVGTVERVIRLLQFVAEEGQFNLKDAAAALSLPPSTTHRLLQLLVRMDLVQRDEQQNYKISREYYRIGSLASRRFDINSAAHPHLAEMSELYDETASFALYMPATHQGMIVETIATRHPLQHRIDLYANWQLTWGSLGRAMLAYLPDPEVEAVLANASPSPATGQPVPTMQSLAAELAGIRALGHYVSINQNVLGATGTAAVVLGLDGRVIGSIGITIPVARYKPESQPEISALVMRHAQALSASLGYNGEETPRRAPTISPITARRRASRKTIAS